MSDTEMVKQAREWLTDRTHCCDSRINGATDDDVESLAALLTETRTKALDEAAAAIPTNWCDSLLTGPEGITLPATCPHIEGLLAGVAERIRALKAEGGEI